MGGGPCACDGNSPSEPHIANLRAQQAPAYGTGLGRTREREMKTLEDAIGCWTTSQEGLKSKAALIANSVKFCRFRTEENNPQKLLKELRLLKDRISTIKELTVDAIERCHEIINTEELTRD